MAEKQAQFDDLREDYEIFLVDCPHGKWLTISDGSHWCGKDDCGWVDGRPVGDVTIRVVEEDLTIEAWGSGYIGNPEDIDIP